MGCETGKKEDNNWIVQEESFSGRYLGKSETLMALGNGYLGIRSANEESYAGEKRNTFIAGTFNKFDENEVTELPNAADLIRMDIDLNGEAFDLKSGKIISYNKALNLKTGEVKRQITWVSPNGHKFDMVFRRFVSRDNLHLIGQRVEIKPIDSEAEINILSGINGQMTNSGVQHFSEGEKRLFDGKYMQLVQTTSQSKIHFVHNTTLSFELDSKIIEPKSFVIMGRRFIAVNFSCKVKKGKTLVIEKISNVHTSRDIDANENADKEATKNVGKEVYIEVDKKINKEDDVDIEVEKEASIEGNKKVLEELRSLSLSELKTFAGNGYDELLQKSAGIWAKDWNLFDIRVTGNNEFDQLAIRFAIYHLITMTPAHDNRMNIAAKGLTGEGYKGHTFWDTEIFMLPFWTYSKPEVARSLLEYRYLSLPGAYKKARENGYRGAMFPWESAWLEDGEVTPEWGSADVVTGKPVKIWTGFIE
ncbi:MAG: family 65 glycosyl hydrolase, partial [Ruminiclostridium sp.]|nr:family 65 glycosyl hydrolase [Ruminiclostridium sp.]